MLTPSVSFHPQGNDIPFSAGMSAFRDLPSAASAQHTVQLHDLPPQALKAVNAYPDGDEQPEWTEEDIVYLHWRLLSDLDRLADPLTPLEEKFDTLAWVFSEPHLESEPFSFSNCLRVVGSSPLSPTPFFGKLDVQSIRDWIKAKAKGWVRETLAQYPEWVRREVSTNFDWMIRQLSKNPQWINEQIKLKTSSTQADLFAMEVQQ